MRLRTILVAVGLLLVGTCTGVAIDLTRDAGLGVEGPDGYRFRYRPGSWVVKLTGATCTVIGNTTHCRADHYPSAYLLGHEYTHVEQQRGKFVPLWLIRYHLGAADSLEAEAHRKGCERRNDPFWVRLSGVLSRVRVFNSFASLEPPAAQPLTCEGL